MISPTQWPPALIIVVEPLSTGSIHNGDTFLFHCLIIRPRNFYLINTAALYTAVKLYCHFIAHYYFCITAFIVAQSSMEHVIPGITLEDRKSLLKSGEKAESYLLARGLRLNWRLANNAVSIPTTLLRGYGSYSSIFRK